jgi:hypothetical protein
VLQRNYLRALPAVCYVVSGNVFTCARNKIQNSIVCTQMLLLSRAGPTLVVHLSGRYFKGQLRLFRLTLLCALLSLRSYIIQTVLRVLEVA